MQTILAGTDFSDAATRATDYAVSLAGFLGAKLILVHARSLPVSWPADDFPRPDNVVTKDDLQKQLEKEKQRLIRKLGFDPGIEPIVDEGNEVSVIRHCADKTGAELVVVGSHGATADFGMRPLGGNALAIATQLKIPTLIVPYGAAYKPVRHLTFACDYRFDQGSTVLQFARAMAHLFGAELEILNVTVGIGEREFVPSEAHAYVEERLDNTTHKTILLHNDDVAHSVINYVRKNDTDILLLHPRRHSIFDRLFRQSVTRDVMSQVDCPVLVIPRST